MTDETFLTFASKVLEERAEDGIRGIAKERNRFRNHVATAAFAAKALSNVQPVDVADWLREMSRKQAKDRRGGRTLSRATVERASALVSVVFSEALSRGLIPLNPCVGIRPKRRSGEAATKETWAYLTLAEQRAIMSCAAIAEADRLAIQFAFGTGLRQGEQFNLEVRDLHPEGDEPFVFVRFGSPGKPPKSGKVRRVPLFGPGLEASKRWLDVLPAYCRENPLGLAFPTPSGRRRGIGKPLGQGRVRDGRWTDPFKVALRQAGITKPFRWHDLRHSTASALVIGMWGRAWRLEEIQPLMGHSSITITQRYAHLGEDALKVAARETVIATPAPLALHEDGPRQVRNHLRGLAKAVMRAVTRRGKEAGNG